MDRSLKSCWADGPLHWGGCSPAGYGCRCGYRCGQGVREGVRVLGPFPPLGNHVSMVKHLSTFEMFPAEIFTEVVFGLSGPQQQLDSSLWGLSSFFCCICAPPKGEGDWLNLRVVLQDSLLICSWRVLPHFSLVNMDKPVWARKSEELTLRSTKSVFSDIISFKNFYSYRKLQCPKYG